MTLRQLHYQLIGVDGYRNTQDDYKELSRHTAERRRRGTFPDLIEHGRPIVVPDAWADADAGHAWFVDYFRVDRTEGQAVTVVVIVEKATLRDQLAMLVNARGIPVVVVQGYASQTLVDNVCAYVDTYARPAVAFYVGDWDASGMDIERDFRERTDCWHAWERLALHEHQVVTLGLPEALGKEGDSRKAAFIAAYGRNVQVELDALPVEVLRDLVLDAVDAWWDAAAARPVTAREAVERARLKRARLGRSQPTSRMTRR